MFCSWKKIVDMIMQGLTKTEPESAAENERKRK